MATGVSPSVVNNYQRPATFSGPRQGQGLIGPEGFSCAGEPAALREFGS